MVRPLDSATLAAINNRSVVIPRNFISVTARDGAGAPVMFGFTDFGDTLTIEVIDGLTGSAVSRTYDGDNRPIIDMDPIPMKIGLEVDTTQVMLNPLHPAVQSMYRGYDCRNAPVQIHIGYLSPDTYTFVAPPTCRRLGWINGAPEELAAVGSGGDSTLTLQIVSATRELTRTNPAKRSDETQRLRSGDRARKYSGTAYKWPIWWGEAKAGGANTSGGVGAAKAIVSKALGKS